MRGKSAFFFVLAGVAVLQVAHTYDQAEAGWRRGRCERVAILSSKPGQR